MITLRLSEGDLVLNGGSFAVISGPDKVRQDLSFALREALGVDRFHPRWGSLLDSFVGEPTTSRLQARVVDEARRVVGNYRLVQQDRMEQDSREGRPSRYGSGEVIHDVTSITATQNTDRIIVKIDLLLLSGEDISILTQTGP